MEATNRIEWTKEVRTREVRQISKCKCGAVAVRTVSRTTTTEYRSDRIAAVSRRSTPDPIPAVCPCGRSRFFQDIAGRKTSTKCGAKCTNSTGHVCECSCGGRNHGAGHAVEGA